ncbi:FMN-dependent NADH-azoreductase [Alkalicoccus urumqiensis]|uniref:FMN dependent NADH:quinone oxidoreductase n=1 Tax=Alkalicoccus urumqiensis TaxID=1548213 RepID=A0A2P6MIN8_ALKUR|nr:FMN-dependent NADH-azoreductase [Alkalicoccus urumqiensis]PRO66162.1 FMN-dependent NADH-azoreductase [Alkalicoccus urumqiensis]
MANVLFIKANSRPDDQAVSLQMYNKFKDQYLKENPNDRIEELDLFEENLPYYDADKIHGMFKTAKGMELSLEEEKAAALVKGYLDQFLNADKVVLAFPLWNFSVPAVLHTYFDYLCQAGTTFKYTEEGPVGLLNDKKVMLLNARGGVYSEGAAASMEMAVNYVETIMTFFGIENRTSVIIEGHNQFPDKAGEIIEEGMEKIEKQASSF